MVTELMHDVISLDSHFMLIVKSVNPLFSVAAFELRFHEASEFATANGPSRSVTLGFPYLQNKLSALAVEGVDVNPNAFIKDLSNSSHSIFIALFVVEATLRTPKTFA